MELKPDYKQTEVGVIPEDWDVATVSDACDLVVDCKNRTPPFVSHSEFAVVRTSNVRNGRFVDVDLRFTDYESFRRWTSRATPKTGDIMLTREAPLGEVCAVPETPSVCLGQRMMLLRPSGHVAQSSYLLFTLMSEVVKGNLLKKIGGSTVGHAKVDDIRLLPVPLPPLEEQKHISAILLDVDNLVRDLESLIAKKQGVKQAAMQELLTGKRRLPGFEGEWEVKRLGEIGKCHRGVSYKGDADLMPHDTANTIRLLRSNNVQDSFVKTAELKHVNSKRVATHQILTRDDIVICMANGSKALVGKAGRFQVSDGYEYTFGAFMGCFRTIPAKADPGFAFYLLQTDRYQRLIGDLLAGSSINNLKPSSLESLEFLFPERSEQQAIAAVLSDIDAELTYLTHRRDSIQEIKQGMMQQLLTGKIRLT